MDIRLLITDLSVLVILLLWSNSQIHIHTLQIWDKPLEHITKLWLYKNVSEITRWLPRLDEGILQLEFNFWHFLNRQHGLLQQKGHICTAKIFFQLTLAWETSCCSPGILASCLRFLPLLRISVKKSGKNLWLLLRLVWGFFSETLH